ncbi:MAG: siroheme decarboxylase subunit beta [Planctomycetota bacterium]
MSDIERKVLAALQEGFPRSEIPYKDMAEKAGIETKQLLEVLENWKREGKLRRIGAIVDHFKVGLSGGAMVVWQVEEERVEEVGEKLSGFREVSHAYERNRVENWPYNVYTMVHGANFEEVEKTVARMSQMCGVSNYRILVTEKELKKVPPTYITESGANNTKEEE